MSISVCSLSSGSKGNCTYIASTKARVLVDAGITLAQIEKRLHLLKVDACTLDAILVTHTHSDHISAIETLVKKYNTAVYCSEDSIPLLLYRAKSLTLKNIIPFYKTDFFVKDITVSPFDVSHDVPTVGYSFYCKQKKVSVATDLGVVTEKVINSIAESNLALLECNHDQQMLLNGSYPTMLKKRVSGKKGHLSNDACADACVQLADSGTRQIILAHLSQQNNTHELALNTVSNGLLQRDYVVGQNINVEVAFQDRLSSLFEVI